MLDASESVSKRAVEIRKAVYELCVPDASDWAEAVSPFPNVSASLPSKRLNPRSLVCWSRTPVADRLLLPRGRFRRATRLVEVRRQHQRERSFSLTKAQSVAIRADPPISLDTKQKYHPLEHSNAFLGQCARVAAPSHRVSRFRRAVSRSQPASPTLFYAYRRLDDREHLLQDPLLIRRHRDRRTRRKPSFLDFRRHANSPFPLPNRSSNTRTAMRTSPLCLRVNEKILERKRIIARSTISCDRCESILRTFSPFRTLDPRQPRDPLDRVSR